MNQRTHASLVLLLLACLSVPAAHAGLNEGAQAWLSWSSSGIQSDLTTPGSVNNLYVRVTGAGSFKGAELDLIWSPEGDGEACYAHIGTLFSTSTGCTYMNRGTAVPVTIADTLGHLHIAWANNETNTSCTSASNIVKLQFAFDGCDDTAGCFRLVSLKLLDGAGEISDVALEGAEATVLGGSNECEGLEDGQNAYLGAPPYVSALPDRTVLAGTPVSVSPVATDNDGDTLTWSGTNLPDGASVDPVTGTLSWTPEDAGTFRGITLTASDGTSSSSAAFSVYSLDEETESAGGPMGQMGVFRVVNSPTRDVDLRALGVQWTYRDVRPNLDAAYVDSADADLRIFGPQRVEVVFNIVRADSVDDLNRYVSMAPSDSAEWATWHSVVNSLVERYDGDGTGDMPGLPIAVHYWHLEEEDTFWRDFHPNSYVDYVDSMANWIHKADSTAKVISMGLGSENCWQAAFDAGKVKLNPNTTCYVPSDSYAVWLDRTTDLLSSGAQDIVDVHCYEVYPIIKGKLDWVREVMDQNQKPIWVFEAAGPYTGVSGEPCDDPLPYNQTLNGRFAWGQFAQAFANGVGRMAWAYKGKGTESQQCGDFDCDPRFRRTALMDDTSSVRHTLVTIPSLERGDCCADSSKPSFRNYLALNRYIRGFTSAVDSTIIPPGSSIKENDYFYKLGFFGPGTDEQVWVVWRPEAGSTDSVNVFVPNAWTDSVEVARASEVRAEGVAISKLPIVNHRVRVPLANGVHRIVSSTGTLTSVLEEAERPLPPMSLRVAKQGSRVELAWSAPSNARKVTIEFYDVRGRRVHFADIERGKGQVSGTYAWNPVRAGGYFASGVYFARLRAGGLLSTGQRLLVLR